MNKVEKIYKGCGCKQTSVTNPPPTPTPEPIKTN
jgi:hypothetical protein